MITILMFLLMVGAAASPLDGSTVEPSVALPAPFANILRQYENAWRAKDAAKLSQLFAEDGYVLPSGGPMVHGRSAIQELYKGQGGPLFLHAVAYGAEGTVGYIIGTFRHESNGPDSGKFTLTLTKSPSGEWLILSDMDNGNHP